MEEKTNVKASTLIWKILLQALLSHPSHPNPGLYEQTQMGIKHISRRSNRGFNLIPSHLLDEPQNRKLLGSRDARVCYTLPVHGVPQLFLRSKIVIELGSGYGLAGFVIAAVTEASEAVISDGNPQVVNYIQNNIEINSGIFGDTMHFKDFRKYFARIIKLLSSARFPEPILLSPKRGDSLDMFLEVVKRKWLAFQCNREL